MRDAPARPTFDPRFAKQIVNYITDEKPGTVVVDTVPAFSISCKKMAGRSTTASALATSLYLVGHQVRLAEARMARLDAAAGNAEAPARLTDLDGGQHRQSAGTRAIYLGSSLYRIHGSNEPHAIELAVSSGCFRMRNDDVMDLYDKVKIGTKVVVI